MKTAHTLLAALILATLALSPSPARADDGELDADAEAALAAALGFFSVETAQQTYIEILVLSDAYVEELYDEATVLGVCAGNEQVLSQGLEHLKVIARLETFKAALQPIIALYDAVLATNAALVAFVQAETEDEIKTASAAFKAAKAEVEKASEAFGGDG